MSNLLSYRAIRSAPLTRDEAQAIDIVIARYQSDFEYRDDADVFTLDPSDPDEPDVIFSGSVRLISEAEAEEDARYWADCLTDIRRILEDAAWQVFFGDQLLSWDEDDGFLFPEA